MNISDIAVKAGVSVSTVSRVINNSPNVNVDTRSRILQIMEETGYVPSSIARNMMSKSNRSIGLFITDILNPFFNEIIKGVENVVNAEGYSLLMQYIHLNNEQRSDGSVFAIILTLLYNNFLLLAQLLLFDYHLSVILH